MNAAANAALLVVYVLNEEGRKEGNKHSNDLNTNHSTADYKCGSDPCMH